MTSVPTPDSLPSYGTHDERAYLESLASSPAASTLLSNYLTAANKRAVWGAIDRIEVVQYARQLLQSKGRGAAEAGHA